MSRFVSLIRPTSDAVPLILDSPHSGSLYTDDFRSSAPMHVLRRGEDNYVDDLLSSAPSVGAALLLAHFPRPYLDANRTENDIDPALLESPFPIPLAPTRKSEVGRGLIWSRVPPDGHPIYDRLLSVAEVQARIETCWRPYHSALTGEISALRQKFGSVWHVNCHSYPGEFDKIANGRPVDFVIGDMWGKTCDTAFSALFAQSLSDLGYNVVMNDPFPGGELSEIYADPKDNRHSVMLEVARRTYMDPVSLEKTADYPKIKSDLATVLKRVAAFVASKIGTA
jgi:N-formylglutamate deformylase